MRSTCPPLLLACVVLALIAIPAAASALTVTGISPAVSYVDNARTCDVYGTGFAVGAQVALTPSAGGTVIAATGEDWIDFTHIRCTVTVPPGAVTGLYAVTVQNPKADSGSKADAFIVYARPDHHGDFVPGPYSPGVVVHRQCLRETGFVAGTRGLHLRGGTGGTSTIFATGETVVGPTQSNCNFNIPRSMPTPAPMTSTSGVTPTWTTCSA